MMTEDRYYVLKEYESGGESFFVEAEGKKIEVKCVSRSFSTRINQLMYDSLPTEEREKYTEEASDN